MMEIKHPNRPGSIRTNYMVRKYPRKGNPHRRSRRGSMMFREPGCWYCLPGNRKKFIQALREIED